jgi:hypothetical protein
VVALIDKVKVADGRLHLPLALTAAIVMLVAIVLGYLGWVLPSPGGSLVVPTLIVFGIGCAAGIACWIIAGSWVTAVAVVGVTVLASVWTFSFSLPASVAWDSNATSQAQTALQQLASSPRNQYGVPLRPCSTRTTGSVGPIGAPYRQCSVSTPEGHFVIFTAGGLTGRGLGYTDVGAATFPDQCSRHLTGEWWMFTRDSSGTSGCPIGYQFHGGG